MSATYSGHFVEISRKQTGMARRNESGQPTTYTWQKMKTIHWSRPTSSIIKTSQCSSTVNPGRWEEEKRQTQEDMAGQAERWPTSDGRRLGRGQVCCWWQQRMEIHWEHEDLSLSLKYYLSDLQTAPKMEKIDSWLSGSQAVIVVHHSYVTTR